MTKAKMLDAVRRAGRTFVQAAGAYLVLNPSHISTSKALAVGAAAAGLSAVWRLFLDPAEPAPAVGGWLPLIEPQQAIQVHVAGTDPAKVADEVAKAVRRHPSGGTVDTGALTRRPVNAEPPPPDPGKRSP